LLAIQFADNFPSVPASPHLRPATSRDEDFLFRLYASTRMEELAATEWSTRERRVFLQQQFRARAQSYAAEFPGAQSSVITLDGLPIGCMIVHRSATEIRLVDLALLPEFRRRGIGRTLVETLQTEAGVSQRPLRLAVREDNAARRLYQRLGFSPVAQAGVHLRMEWNPVSRSSDGLVPAIEPP
jgi:ribosomal protein S18 acetylase RimI-like enzyme